MPLVLTKDNFETALRSALPFLVGFWSVNCGPCRKMAPIMAKLSKQYLIGKVNIDEDPELTKEQGVESIPHLLLFKDGKIIKRLKGIQSYNYLEILLKDNG